MGLTLSSLHIYSKESIDPALGRFISFSEGWQTMLGVDDRCVYSLPYLRKISKKIAAPVLAFGIFDDDYIMFSIYEKGKQVVFFSSSDRSGKKGIFMIPGLLGYPEGHKRRVAEILRCDDLDLLVELLEEFFGVALLVLDSDAEEKPQTLKRTRSDVQYRAYHEKEKHLRGKYAPVRVVLTQERSGKVFIHDPYEFPNTKECAPGYYLFGYDRPESKDKDLRMVHFANGRLEPADAGFVPVKNTSPRDPRFQIEYTHSGTKVTFSDECPDDYRGKTLLIPENLFPLGFDGKQRFVLWTLGSIAFMDSNGKFIAKCAVRGCPTAIADDHLLTVGLGSMAFFYYEPQDKIRIYQLVDRQETTP